MSFVAPPSDAPLEDVGRAIDALYGERAAWQVVASDERAALLESCAASIAAAAHRWADAAARIEGVAPTIDRAGEARIGAVAPAIRHARSLARALRGGRPPRLTELRARADGRTVVRVFPANGQDALVYGGIVVDALIPAGAPATAWDRAARGERESRVRLLFAGPSPWSAPVPEALHALFVEDDVVLLVVDPAAEALIPVLVDALAPLVTAGCLAIAKGSAEAGARAASNDKVRAVAAADPLTPVLVVPGPWSGSDVRLHGRRVASMIARDAALASPTTSVVLCARQWLQRDLFLDALRDELAKLAPRTPPAADARRAAFVAGRERAVLLGAPDAEAAAPWAVLPEAGPEDLRALRAEPIPGLYAVLEVEAPDFHGASVPRFLEEAVRLANESCGGGRACSVLVHPATEEAHPAALASAVLALRYETVAVNLWPGAVSLSGPYPFAHADKTVARASFRDRPAPSWVVGRRGLAELGRRTVDFESAPSWGRAVRVALASIGR